MGGSRAYRLQALGRMEQAQGPDGWSCASCYFLAWGYLCTSHSAELPVGQGHAAPPETHPSREIRNVELLKLRFGEAPMHFCEVMLKVGRSPAHRPHPTHRLRPAPAFVRP